MPDEDTQIPEEELAQEVAPAHDLANFDPTKHLMMLSGKQYLPVQARVAWFRQENPNGKIQTQLIEHDFDKQYAMFRATITTEGGGIAEGYGSETYAGFKDYREKAETVAVGRALGFLGYGTLFALELLDGDDGNSKLADSPIGQTGGYGNQQDGPRGNPNSLISDKQVKFAENLARQAGMSSTDLDTELRNRYQVDELSKLNGQQASGLIDYLKGRVQGAPQAQPVSQPKAFESGIASEEELRKALNLSLPHNEQKAIWTKDAQQAFSGNPDDPKTKGDIRFIVSVAKDAVRLDQQEMWRFSDLMRLCLNEAQFTAIARHAAEAGVPQKMLSDTVDIIRAERKF